MPTRRWRQGMFVAMLAMTLAACSTSSIRHSPMPGANDLTTCRLVGYWDLRVMTQGDPATTPIALELIDAAKSAEDANLRSSGQAALWAWNSHDPARFDSQVNQMIGTCEQFGLSIKSGLVPVS